MHLFKTWANKADRRGADGCRCGWKVGHFWPSTSANSSPCHPGHRSRLEACNALNQDWVWTWTRRCCGENFQWEKYSEVEEGAIGSTDGVSLGKLPFSRFSALTALKVGAHLAKRVKKTNHLQFQFSCCAKIIGAKFNDQSLVWLANWKILDGNEINIEVGFLFDWQPKLLQSSMLEIKMNGAFQFNKSAQSITLCDLLSPLVFLLGECRK